MITTQQKKPAKRARRSRSRSPYGNTPSRTSLPTSRAAYQETRQWLLQRHGPVCAYCERRVDPNTVTLDHVTPRRGQSAFDRRDNLVLACTGCNAVKADKPIVTFLLGQRERAASLVRYGSHLSPMLLDLARQLAGPLAQQAPATVSDPDSPYRD